MFLFEYLQAVCYFYTKKQTTNLPFIQLYIKIKFQKYRNLKSKKQFKCFLSLAALKYQWNYCLKITLTTQ